jgi:MoxR-like ATPase
VNENLRETLDRITSPAIFGDGKPTGIPGDDRDGHYWLITDSRVLLAVKVALITGRPLLVEGPSGSGKSALARAVSETLGWTYYEAVVTSQTRLDAFTGWVDLIERLHHAEVASRAGRDVVQGLEAFLKPGVLWWAFDPESAAAAGQRENTNPGQPARDPVAPGGAVVLIDEIDKAEPDLPNNLLVPLGSWQLRIDGRPDVVELSRANRPMVFITSNRERDMPPAFLRRCVVLRLNYPNRDQLVEIARQHVPSSGDLSELVCDQLVPEPNHQVSPAEFVDAVRAAEGLGIDARSSAELWQDVKSIVLNSDRERA